MSFINSLKRFFVAERPESVILNLSPTVGEFLESKGVNHLRMPINEIDELMVKRLNLLWDNHKSKIKWEFVDDSHFDGINKLQFDIYTIRFWKEAPSKKYKIFSISVGEHRISSRYFLLRLGEDKIVAHLNKIESEYYEKKHADRILRQESAYKELLRNSK